MNIETSIERVDRNGSGAVFLNVTCDGMPCGRVVIASGPVKDLDDLVKGAATLPELSERWIKRC